MASTSGNDGTLNLQVTFEVGTDPDIAQVNVQNRVALAQPRLPEEVVRQGISVRKQSTNLLLVINLTSPGRHLRQRSILSNYATINLIDALSRRPGRRPGDDLRRPRLQHADVARRQPHGQPRHRPPATSSQAIREQNVQVAAGQIGAPPSAARPAVPVHHPHPGPAGRRRRLREHHRPRPAGRLERAHQRHRPGRARRPQLRFVRPARRQAVGQHRHLPAARLQRAGRGRRGYRRRWSGCRSAFPPDLQGQHPLRHHPLRRRVDRRGGDDLAGSARSWSSSSSTSSCRTGG